MLTSVLCIFFGLSVIVFIGVPVAYYLWIASDNNGISQIEFWTIAMFAGVSVICTVVKLLFMINIPVTEYSKTLYILVLIFFVLFLWGKRNDNVVLGYIKAPLVLMSGIVIYGLNSIAYILSGAKYYIMYGWSDISYYGMQAEAVRTIPFANWAKLLEQKIWMIEASYFTSGTHRISMAALAALTADLSGTDGSSAMGFLAALTSLLLFIAILYATEEMFISKIKQCVIALFATMLPGVVVSQLSCFLAINFFMSFIIFYCRIFYDYYRKSNIQRCVFLALVISTGITFLLDGVYLLCGLVFVSAIWLLNVKGRYDVKKYCKKIFSIVLSMFLAILLNVQYFPFLREELHWALSRENLNVIYGFAYSSSVFNWIFYGTYRLEALVPKTLCTLLTFVAVTLFIMGVSGLVMQMVKKHSGICLNFLAVFVASLLFYSEPGEHQYVFLKVLHFSFALIVVGIFLFVKHVRGELYQIKGKMSKLWYHTTAITVCIILSFCVMCSFVKQMALLPGLQKNLFKYSDGISDGIVTQILSKSARSLYRKMETTQKPILLVCNNRQGDNHKKMWWASYYGRNNDVYVLAGSQLNDFLQGRESLEAGYLKVPSDCEIISLDEKEYIYPKQKRKDYAVYMEREDEYGLKNVVDFQLFPEEMAKEYSLYVYARQTAKVSLRLEIDRDCMINCNGSSEKSKNNEIMSTFELQEGVNQIQLSSEEGEFKITDYNLHILQ